MSASYDYLALTLVTAPTPHQTLAAHLREVGPVLDKGGGEVVGQFAPQLGWASNQAAVLVRWASGAGGDAGPIVQHTDVVAQAHIDRVTPTLRPAADAQLPAGGVYVHRWFEVSPAAAVAEFIDLSGQGWQRFEAQFDAHIFGLFTAEPTLEDKAADLRRLLLITRYGDHGVWEASRDPTSEAMQIFARRRQLTRRTWAASTLLV